MELKLAIQKYPDLYNSLILGAKSLEEANELLMYLARNEGSIWLSNSHSIAGAFSWRETKQGKSFWLNFHKRAASAQIIIV